MLKQTYQRRRRRKRVKELECQQITESVQLKKMERYVRITARKRSLVQGNIFTPVCHSVHGGVCLSACRDTTPRTRHTPLDPAPQTRHPCLPRPDTPRACWEIRSTRGRYASYWNASLYHNIFTIHWDSFSFCSDSSDFK